MAANDKKGRRRRLPSNAIPRLPSRAWALSRLSSQQAELAWITRRRVARHLAAVSAPRTARGTVPTQSPNRRRTRMSDYPRPGYYHAPDYIRAAARDKIGRAVRDMVLRLTGDPRARVELPPPASSPPTSRPAPASQPRSSSRTRAGRPRPGRRAHPTRPSGRPHAGTTSPTRSTFTQWPAPTRSQPADEAFSFALQYRSIADHRDIIWICPTCQQKITDHGPWDELPEQEDGHTADCPRRTAELTAWQARNPRS